LIALVGGCIVQNVTHLGILGLEINRQGWSCYGDQAACEGERCHLIDVDGAAGAAVRLAIKPLQMGIPPYNIALLEIPSQMIATLV
jgi:hypothetical protein